MYPDPPGCDFMTYNTSWTSRRTTQGPCGAWSLWDLGWCFDIVGGLASKSLMPSGKVFAMLSQEMARTFAGSRESYPEWPLARGAASIGALGA